MPRNQFQRMVFAFITVVITVHAFVFYNIYVLNGDMLRSFNYTSSVLTAVNKQGGIMMFGTMLPVWAVVLVEFAFAYTLCASTCRLRSSLSTCLFSRLSEEFSSFCFVRTSKTEKKSGINSLIFQGKYDIIQNNVSSKRA